MQHSKRREGVLRTEEHCCQVIERKSMRKTDERNLSMAGA